MDGPFNDVEKKADWVVLNVPSLAPIERELWGKKAMEKWRFFDLQSQKSWFR